MNQSRLSAERARELFNYDPATGSLTWKAYRRGATLPQGAERRLEQGYIRLGVEGRKYLAHRLIWLITTGRWPTGVLDHVNGVRSDNRLCNLRESTPQSNSENRRHAQADSKTGLLGVSVHKGRFRAVIWSKGTRKTLGAFPTPEEAHQAYLTAKRQLHAGCTI